MSEVNENIVNDEKGLYTAEEVANLVSELLPTVEVDINKCQGFELDQCEFSAGVDSVSFIAGQFSALKSVGMTPDMAMEYILNRENIEFNLELNQDTAKSNLDVAKVQQVVAVHNQL